MSVFIEQHNAEFGLLNSLLRLLNYLCFRKLKRYVPEN